MISTFDFGNREQLDLKFNKYIRHLQTGIDTSKLIIATDDCKVYIYDLEKRTLAANGILEGHVDLITGLDTFKNQLSIVTW